MWGKKGFGAGELVLWLTGTLVKAKDDQKSHVVTFKDVKYTIVPYKALTDFDQTAKFEASAALVPFWWVKSTNDANLVNMSIVQKDVDGISIPVLQNTTQVAEHTLLLQASKDLASKLAAAAPPAKRQRSKGAGQWSIWAMWHNIGFWKAAPSSKMMKTIASGMFSE